MRKTINLKKGLNLRIEGALADTNVSATVIPANIAIVPDDFPGFMPKPDVNSSPVR